LFKLCYTFNQQVVPCEIIELDDDPDVVTILEAKTLDHKNKQAVAHPMNWQKNAKVNPLSTCLLLVPSGYYNQPMINICFSSEWFS
jgi:hypothetical protein